MTVTCGAEGMVQFQEVEIKEYGANFVPRVIEPSFGIDRCVMQCVAVCCGALQCCRLSSHNHSELIGALCGVLQCCCMSSSNLSELNGVCCSALQCVAVC